jgi:hypothetical protein
MGAVSMTRGERLLLVLTPVVALTAVALGLRFGAGELVQAAIVYGAPLSKGGTGLAWQVVALRESSSGREPMAGCTVDVLARTGDRVERWQGVTNEDGVAEALLALPSDAGVELEVRAGGSLLAKGEALAAAAPAPPSPASPWMAFARREGAIELDVAVLGQRAAPGFPARIWVRATDGTTHAPVTDATIEIESASLVPAAPGARTDSRGWADLAATPIGLAVEATLQARGTQGREGRWSGGLHMSPGAVALETRPRWAPDEEPEIHVVAPFARTTVYVEVDDAHGRAWATVVPLLAQRDAIPRAVVHAPKLAPGLYWAVGASAPAGAAGLGPGTIVRPFFVAASDEAALSFGTDWAACSPPRDVRETARAVGSCLAVSAARPVPRWVALDGFAAQHARDGERRALGLAVAVSAIVVASLLEVVLLLRAAASANARLLADAGRKPDARAWRVAVALLVALLGFALLAAFLVRTA